MPQSGVQLKLDRGGGVTVFCGSTDIGQGSDTILAAIVAEVLGHRSVRHPRRHGRHRSDAGGSRLLLVPRDAHDGQRGDPGRRSARGRCSSTAAAAKLGIPEERVGLADGRVFDVAEPRKGHVVSRGRRRSRSRASARSGRSARTRRRPRRAATGAPASGRRRPTRTPPPSSRWTSTRRRASTRCRRSGSRTTSASASIRVLVDGPGRGLRLHGPRRGA